MYIHSHTIIFNGDSPTTRLYIQYLNIFSIFHIIYGWGLLNRLLKYLDHYDVAPYY